MRFLRRLPTNDFPELLFGANQDNIINITLEDLKNASGAEDVVKLINHVLNGTDPNALSILRQHLKTKQPLLVSDAKLTDLGQSLIEWIKENENEKLKGFYREILQEVNHSPFQTDDKPVELSRNQWEDVVEAFKEVYSPNPMISRSGQSKINAMGFQDGTPTVALARKNVEGVFLTEPGRHVLRLLQQDDNENAAYKKPIKNIIDNLKNTFLIYDKHLLETPYGYLQKRFDGDRFRDVAELVKKGDSDSWNKWLDPEQKTTLPPIAKLWNDDDDKERLETFKAFAKNFDQITDEVMKIKSDVLLKAQPTPTEKTKAKLIITVIQNALKNTKGKYNDYLNLLEKVVAENHMKLHDKKPLILRSMEATKALEGEMLTVQSPEEPAPEEPAPEEPAPEEPAPEEPAPEEPGVNKEEEREVASLALPQSSIVSAEHSEPNKEVAIYGNLALLLKNSGGVWVALGPDVTKEIMEKYDLVFEKKDSFLTEEGIRADTLANIFKIEGPDFQDQYRSAIIEAFEKLVNVKGEKDKHTQDLKDLRKLILEIVEKSVDGSSRSQQAFLEKIDSAKKQFQTFIDVLQAEATKLDTKADTIDNYEQILEVDKLIKTKEVAAKVFFLISGPTSDPRTWVQGRVGFDTAKQSVYAVVRHVKSGNLKKVNKDFLIDERADFISYDMKSFFEMPHPENIDLDPVASRSDTVLKDIMQNALDQLGVQRVWFRQHRKLESLETTDFDEYDKSEFEKLTKDLQEMFDFYKETYDEIFGQIGGYITELERAKQELKRLITDKNSQIRDHNTVVKQVAESLGKMVKITEGNVDLGEASETQKLYSALLQALVAHDTPETFDTATYMAEQAKEQLKRLKALLEDERKRSNDPNDAGIMRLQSEIKKSEDELKTAFDTFVKNFEDNEEHTQLRKLQKKVTEGFTLSEEEKKAKQDREAVLAKRAESESRINQQVTLEREEANAKAREEEDGDEVDAGDVSLEDGTGKKNSWQKRLGGRKGIAAALGFSKLSPKTDYAKRK